MISMHDNRWEGEKEEDKEKEDRVKREKPKKKKEKKEGEEEEEQGEKVADKANPPTTPKVESQTFAVWDTIFVSKNSNQINL